MKTVTSTFSSTITKPQIQVIRQISYKRRYWSTVSGGVATTNTATLELFLTGNGSAFFGYTSHVNVTAVTLVSSSVRGTLHAVGSGMGNDYVVFTLNNLTNPAQIEIISYTPAVGELLTATYTYVTYSGAYIWESGWTALPETQVIGVSPITAQLDTQSENEFQVANTTITLANFQNQWVLTNPASIFGVDAGSPVYGYVPTWTKFQINAGLVYPGGSTELVTIFTGVATEFNFNSTDSQVQITVSGEQIFLVNTKAQSVSTTSTLENIGTGNSSNKVFNTAHVGVGIISAVYVAGVLQTAGTAYTISNLNIPATAATVTFVTAPSTGQAVTCTYIYWIQGDTIETLVAALATASGISSGNQQITPVVFPNQITNTHKYSAQAGWESGTLANSVTEDGSNNLLSVVPYAASTFTGGTFTGQTVNGGTSLTLTPASTSVWMYPSAGFGFFAGPSNPVPQAVIMLQAVSIPLSCTITSISISYWTGSVAGDTYNVVVYADNGSSAPNFSGNLYTSPSTYSNPASSDPHPVFTAPNPSTSISVFGAQTIWVGIKRATGTGYIAQEWTSHDTAAKCVVAGTTTSPSFSPAYDSSNATGSSHLVGMEVLVSYTPSSTVGTWQSPSHDTGSIQINTAVTLSAVSTLPSGTSYIAYIDGSADNSTFDVTYSVSNLNGTSPITVANRRYWRFRYALTATATLNMPTVYLPTLNFGTTGTWISPVLDMTFAPNSFGALQIGETLNGGTDQYYTSVSSDNITYDAYVAVSGTLFPQSALKRYIKVKVVQTQNSLQTASPSIASISVVWLSSTLTITLANFTGDTAYDAIQALAGMANYEFGFDSQENFFFRPKSPSITPVMSLDQSTFVVDVLAQTTGVERVYTSVIVTYGSYTAEVDDPGLLPSSPLTIYGYNQLQPSSSQLLISPDANVAAGMAQTLFNFWSIIRSEIKIATTFLPQLDLSDIINLSFHNNAPNPAWFWGDPAVYWGMPGLYYYGGNNQLLHNVVCKVVGYRIDTDDWSCEYDLEEVV